MGAAAGCHSGALPKMRGKQFHTNLQSSTYVDVYRLAGFAMQAPKSLPILYFIYDCKRTGRNGIIWAENV